MAFSRNWDTIAETWEAVSTTWDFAEDSTADNLSLGVTESSAITLSLVGTDSASVGVTEFVEIAVSMDVTSTDSVTLSSSETQFVASLAESSDTLGYSLTETSDDMYVELLSGTELTFSLVEESAEEVEDWPGSSSLFPIPWAKSPASTSIWTKVPADTSSPWS